MFLLAAGLGLKVEADKRWNSLMTFAVAVFTMRMPVPQETCWRD
jgi:hypothetical protein